MIVRLKVGFSCIAARAVMGFNSMIVRLKVVYNVSPHGSTTFQFYDSPIKSDKQIRDAEGRIVFQFYDSPIKSPTHFTPATTDPARFNSMIVRLKGIWSVYDACTIPVSIL